METTQEPKEQTKMMAIPLSVHTRLAGLKQPHEPFYSVISRLMDNMAQTPKESGTSVNVGSVE